MSNLESEIVKIIQQSKDKIIRWQPIVGNETLSLLAHFRIPEAEKDRIKDEAVSILSKCVPPIATDEALTGLVIGYVQSGKTMSFTTVTALAKDNGYQIVIVIAGTSTSLLTQSTNRLIKDLRLDNRDDRQWQHFESSIIKPNDYDKIKSTLDDWRDPSVLISERKTVLITVMKHHGHLQKVHEILKRLNLEQVPTLIIDDEADQASLNAKVKKGHTSTTYQRILSLKDQLPHHTFLQYTATPQAPLLINLIDVLSPQFAEILTPGQGYTGGKDFFGATSGLIKTIPDDEIPSEEALYGPPDSLIDAMKLYFLGVACGLVLDGGKGNRSMLVHPSHKTIGHREFYGWIEKTKSRWQRTLELPETDPDKQNLLEDFKYTYEDLNGTVTDLPPFTQLSERLLHAIRQTNLEEVNARRGQTPHVNWKNAYAHILVGGQAMDRGFTVEGLTVTYMPRGAGTGNVDTIQQRARFFGYKKDYQEYCRIFLESRVHDAYRSSIIHEESVRDEIIDHNKSSKPLTEWKRAFFLDKKLQPTRRSVIDLDYMRGNFSNQWFSPKAPHDSPDASQENLGVINKFLTKFSFKDDKGDSRRTPEQKHKVACGILLNEVYEELLVQFRITRLDDSQKFTGLLLQIKNYLEENPKATCTVYRMSGGKPRERKVDKSDEIPNLFQGENAPTGYPGDRKIITRGELTVQIHILKVKSSDSIHLNVPALVVKVPKEMSADWLIQNQGGSKD
jgi:hypothetical protein